ncbi:tautomerase family protein [Bradyrhizobium sp. CIAT3101]|uniref:tautomerase family protein n=1 Tax=Bradyrhizobium sp. CIAT3101 TaxID=439387 RepID=UPI0024B1053D|nr:tautomerase family protein [Bradyrhizobium sp. CIAT3101]WFU84402.1 tautomerase family protein [Bradyrhizobium sp. CIAT3101]
MPKMFVHAPSGVFTAEARASVAAELTDLGMACERLDDTPAIRSGVWVLFAEHEPGSIFSGGRAASHPVIVLLVNAIKGGLDDPARKRLIEEGTAILGKHAAIGEGRVPAYVAIQEIPEINWGMYGKQVDLSSMRAPATA